MKEVSMRIVHHTTHHVLFHLGLFAGFALLIPVITKALETTQEPWKIAPETFFGGVMLIVISAFLLYRVKESLPDLLQSLGFAMFLPGGINVVSSVFNVKEFIAQETSITGLAVVQPVAQFYVEHSVPSVLSVAAVYLFVGGMLYWVGLKWNQAKNKFSPQ